MPVEHYEKRSDSVLAWKKRNALGRFDPEKDQKDAQALERAWEVVRSKGIVNGARGRVGGSEGDRRGTVHYVGEVPEIPNGGLWVGFEADEPTGKLNFSSSRLQPLPDPDGFG
jgi:tubulin-folding cofactor B